MDFCSECGSMILNGSKCPMCGCIKTAETKEVKKNTTARKEKKQIKSQLLKHSLKILKQNLKK